MNEILSKIASQIDGVESESEMLIRLIASIALFALMLIFRNQIAKAISSIICKVLFGKSRKTQRAVAESVHKPLALFTAVSGAYIATEIMFPAGDIHNKALVALKLCFICFTAWFGINLINSNYTFSAVDDFSNSKKTAMNFINNILKIAISVIAVLLVLEQFGISASKLFAALGIGGVAVAFACKDIVENMLSGFIIIFDKPFEVGDFIELNGDSGRVDDIKIRTTRLIGVDGCEKIYPNTAMANSSVTNWTKMQKRAVSETIAVTYSTAAEDIDSIRRGILEVILSNENVLQDDIRVNFTAFGAHALEISVFFYVDKIAAPEYLAVKNDINIALKKYFDTNNVELAFESKTLYFGDELKIQK